ncbi:hypothetical protein [Bordetella genomosp. 9]|uniref:hypothetical protein n=1 Tax=Bordetella genomosp. 9 TaxID=1416803 RepID=UPI0012F7DADA|nr:hypothetical protein [Bordetella genomosp. 9]
MTVTATNPSLVASLYASAASAETTKTSEPPVPSPALRKTLEIAAAHSCVSLQLLTELAPEFGPDELRDAIADGIGEKWLEGDAGSFACTEDGRRLLGDGAIEQSRHELEPHELEPHEPDAGPDGAPPDPPYRQQNHQARPATASAIAGAETFAGRNHGTKIRDFVRAALSHDVASAMSSTFVWNVRRLDANLGNLIAGLVKLDRARSPAEKRAGRPGAKVSGSTKKPAYLLQKALARFRRHMGFKAEAFDRASIARFPISQSVANDRKLVSGCWSQCAQLDAGPDSYSGSPPHFEVLGPPRPLALYQPLLSARLENMDDAKLRAVVAGATAELDRLAKHAEKRADFYRLGMPQQLDDYAQLLRILRYSAIEQIGDRTMLSRLQSDPDSGNASPETGRRVTFQPQ